MKNSNPEEIELFLKLSNELARLTQNLYRLLDHVMEQKNDLSEGYISDAKSISSQAIAKAMTSEKQSKF